MLIAFLVGIAGGSALYGWIRGARRATPATFGVLQLATGLGAAVVVLAFHRLPELFLAGLQRWDSPGAVQALQVAISACALLTFTVFIGATFPCAVAVAARGARRAGRDVGHVYAVNTVGAIAGSALTGFVLVPALGTQHAIALGIAVNLALAAALFLASRGPIAARGLAAAAVAAGAAGAFALPAWDQRVLTSAPAIYGPSLLQHQGRASVGELLRADTTTLFYRDGPSATVAVQQRGNTLMLRVNGKVDASDGVDMPTQLLLGHLPMLVHPEARRVLVIGLGSGVTAGAVARHPVERVEVVELEPAVVEANRFFAEVNGHVLSDPRVRVVLGDGRNVLLTARERSDAIISEPSNPWISGLASLFTVEFFARARERLRPGGVMVQWIQLYGLPPADLRMIVRSFRTAFPVATLWQGTSSDVLLIGQVEAAPLDLGALQRRFESHRPVADDLRRIGIEHWADVLSYFLLTAPEVARFAGEGVGLNTDDRLPLEFSAPRALHAPTNALNLSELRRAATARVPEVAPAHRATLASADVQSRAGRSLLRRHESAEASPWLEQALAAHPGHVPALVAASEAHLALRRPAMARDFAERAVRREPGNAVALHALGVALVGLYRSDEAVPILERAVALDPGAQAYRHSLAVALNARGQ